MALTTRRGTNAITAVVVALLMVIGIPTAAWADSNDDLTAVDSTLSTAVDAFISVYSDQTTSNEEVLAAAQTFTSDAQTAQTDFQSIADATDGDVARFAGRFADESGKMADASTAIADAFTSQDSTALTQAETDLGAAFDAYDATADEYNTYLKTAGDPSYIGWLIVLIVAVVLLILALLFALLTRKQTGLLPATENKKGKVQQASLKRLRWMVVLWAAVFVIGAAVPFFQVVFAQPDASGNYTYRVFWYPLAAGALLTIFSVVQYFRAAARVRREGSAEPFDPNAPLQPAPAQPAAEQPVPAYGGAPVPPAAAPAQPAAAPAQPATAPQAPPVSGPTDAPVEPTH